MKIPRSFSNWTSVIGAVIALISLSMIIFLFVIASVLHQGSSYLGLFIYMVLPSFLILGLLLIPIGMFIKRRRERKRGKTIEKRWPMIDMNLIKHRNAFLIFAIGSCIFLFLSAVGSYEAFHYSESVEFCGTMCHRVMEPEYVAYSNSAHARVGCVECHVGPGADWFVKSKLSGLYQVYSVAFNKYPRPIPTPIESLRPARETCEQCHWPEKFYARQLKVEKHYLQDEENTEWDISLQMKTGPSYSALGLQEGIHWHINPNVKIEYIASDESRGEIPWVKYTNLETNEEHVYFDEMSYYEPADMDTIPSRTMDCMDCHNRPSHHYQLPEFFIDNAITAGNVPRELPYIKKLGMQVSKEIYPTRDTAMMMISQAMIDFYKNDYPDTYANNYALIEKGINGIQDEFNKNIFPEMRVRWDAYPNHISHVQSNGCFRCHSGTHTSETGRTISKDCDQCHSIVAQGTPGSMEFGTIERSLEFKHPVDIGDSWKEYLCIDCHFDL